MPLVNFKMENIIRKFEWETRWLKGEEYYHILKNIKEYSSFYNIPKFSNKTHPPEIYSNPINGLIYFMQGESIENDFGFPRVDMKKSYKWKKTNFITDIPKKKPLVKYLVASATRVQEKSKPAFRMHAVMLNEICEEPLILCHIRQLQMENQSKDDCIIKRSKRVPLSPISDGLHFLLDSANKAISPMRDIGKENDYVKMLNDSTVDKFPALSSHFKPLFMLSKQFSN